MSGEAQSAKEYANDYLFELEYSPYGNPDDIGYKGSYSIAGECVGFLTLDDQFLSIAKVYGIDLNAPVETD